ncbi:MAG: aquaporin [Candidatus Gastranaerophilales bacterium]|nr:aquaporin [Candidatus Gastranaerophilales bacterium]
MRKNLQNYLVEFIGTFFLVLTIIATAYYAQEAAPLAIGAILAIMVYSGGHISGGHYNPAVSLAASMRGALPAKELLPYFVSQILGGIFAVLVFALTSGASVQSLEVSEFGVKELLIAEFLFTFALCYVVLQTATTKSTQGNSYYGFAIGFTVLTGAIAVGGTLCAGAFNPAVALSLGTAGAISWAAAGYTILANLVAGAIAALVFKLTYSEE